MSEAKKYGNCDRHVKYNRSCMDCSAPAEAKPAARPSRFQPRRFICNFVDGTAEFNDTDCPPAEEYLSIGEHEHLLQEAQERERLLTEALKPFAAVYNEAMDRMPEGAAIGIRSNHGEEDEDKCRIKLVAFKRAREALAKIRGTNG